MDEVSVVEMPLNRKGIRGRDASFKTNFAGHHQICSSAFWFSNLQSRYIWLTPTKLYFAMQLIYNAH